MDRLEVLCKKRVAEFFMEAEEKVLPEKECFPSTTSAGGIVMKRNERKGGLPSLLPFPPYRLNSLKLRHSSFLVLLAPPPPPRHSLRGCSWKVLPSPGESKDSRYEYLRGACGLSPPPSSAGSQQPASQITPLTGGEDALASYLA